MELQTKALSGDIEDIDEKGVVTMYVNAFGNVDSDGDISQKGAFTKTISEQFRRMKHLYRHNADLQIGLPIEMKQDDFGLLVRSELNLKKPIAMDVYTDYHQAKRLDRPMEHSIGFKVKKRDTKNRAIITEYELWEYSTVTWGANELATMVDLKSLKNPEQIIEKMNILVEMYNANYTDGRLRQIENALKSLADFEPSEGTQNIEPVNESDNLLKSLITVLEKN